MKKSVLALVLLAASFNFAFVSKVFSASTDPAFTEIWAYLMKGEERFLNQNYGITDIGYFAGEIDNFGKLTGVPNRSKIANFNGRIHLVIAQVSNRALTHFALDPQYNIREKLIDDIVKATQNFDGLQIDFELVAPQDREYFYTFLIALKERISPKPLSIAIGARTKYVDDAYEYEK
ncbi:MAG: hypothetical protein LBC07_03370, partial [Elusimicrobiota bacterium]|nr:hypothetical protein [Elusimicrobiota bacterium]